MINAGCQKRCIDTCTATMKEYLTNSCEKCPCNAKKTSVGAQTEMIVVNKSVVPERSTSEMNKAQSYGMTLALSIFSVFALLYLGTKILTFKGGNQISDTDNEYIRNYE